MLFNTGVMCYFSVAIKIVYGKLGAICVVTSQLGFARPFSIRIFAKNVVPTVIRNGCREKQHFSGSGKQGEGGKGWQHAPKSFLWFRAGRRGR